MNIAIKINGPFRGKPKQTEENKKILSQIKTENGFVFGSLLQKDEDTMFIVIISNKMSQNILEGCLAVEVIPETVGFFIDKFDKNKKPIYTGDIVTCKTKFGMDLGIVKFKNGKISIFWDSKCHFPDNGHCWMDYDLNSKNEIVGNITDNIDLITN